MLVEISRKLRSPFERFVRIEASSGIVLLVAAALAFALANSPLSSAYHALWNASLFGRSLAWLVNDGLMVIFFFVVGLEIRRELHQGELSQWRRAMVPAAAAVGGMLAPAAIYLLVAHAPDTRPGWGVPMATDIAFAVGILTLLGPRVPAALRVLLLALAVIDDLGAILVIALFYSAGISVGGLGVAALAFAAIFAMQRFGVTSKLAYIPPAVLAWAGIYASGVHPTIAGVLVGMVTPIAPGEELLEMLHPYVAYAIMPIFALANAGVSLRGISFDASSVAVMTASVAGLVVGKPAGIVFVVWLLLKLKLGVLPEGLTSRHVLVLGIVAGVGFTMSLFVAQLAFTDLTLLAAAKLGVLVASVAAALLAFIVGRLVLSRATTQ